MYPVIVIIRILYLFLLKKAIKDTDILGPGIKHLQINIIIKNILLLIILYMNW